MNHCRNANGLYRVSRLTSTFVLVALSQAVFAGNEVNPDAIEIAPMPVPVEYKADIDTPVAFDATTTVSLECPDASAGDWLSGHFKEWYGSQAPKVKLLSTINYQLPTNQEAYSANADANGVKIAARSLAGVRWAAYSLRQLAIAKRGTFKTEGRILPTLKIADHPHLALRPSSAGCPRRTGTFSPCLNSSASPGCAGFPACSGSRGSRGMSTGGSSRRPPNPSRQHGR